MDHMFYGPHILWTTYFMDQTHTIHSVDTAGRLYAAINEMTVKEWFLHNEVTSYGKSTAIYLYNL